MRGIRLQRAVGGLKYVAMIAACVLLNVPPLPEVRTQASHGSGAHLYLFWDGADVDIPSGWSLVSDYNNRFLRGDTVANFGTTASSTVHTPTTSSVATNIHTAGATNSSGTVASVGHTHPPASVTVGAASNNDEPAFRSLKLIRYDGGIPSFVPAGAIAMFDSIPTSEWTRLSAHDGRFIKVNSSIANGGSDTHTHSLAWSGLGAATGTSTRWDFFSNINVAASGHTHSAPPASSTASVATLPPHVRPMLAKADVDTQAIPANLLGMFDGFAGSGWVHRSETGQTFHEQFLRPAAVYDEVNYTGLQTTHTHVPETAETGSNSSSLSSLSFGSGGASINHNHTLTATFNAAEHLPDYFNIAIAEKINFILRDYRWYVDTDAEDVTDPWGRIDVAQNAAITTTPPRNDPPVSGRELRLRVKIEISGENLPANDIGFKLQYKQGTDQNCTTDSWTDLGAGGSGVIWRFASSSVTDGTSLSTSRLSPSSSNLQMYVKSNGALNNPNGSNVGNTIEYDFHIEHNGASTGTIYSFRVIEGGGALLAEYAQCPTLTTMTGTDQQMRHGSVFESESERGFIWAD